MADSLDSDHVRVNQIDFGIFERLGLDQDLRAEVGVSALAFIAQQDGDRALRANADRLTVQEISDQRQLIQWAIGASIFVNLIHDGSIPVEFRAKLANVIFPEGEEKRRSLERLKNYDSLTGMPDQNAFDLALSEANADPKIYFLKFDAYNLKPINNKVAYRAGSALLKTSADCIKLAAQTYGTERYFRLGGDETVVLTTQENALPIVTAAQQNLAERIASGEPFEYLSGEFFPLELYKAFEMGYHFGHGSTFEEADAMLRAAKEKYHQNAALKSTELPT